MLEIVVLTPWFPNRPDGWPARFVSDSARAMAKRGNCVRVGVIRGFIPPGLERWARPEHRGDIESGAFEEIDEIRQVRYPTLPKSLLRPLTNRALDAAVRNLLRGMADSRRPDVVVVHTEGLAPAAIQTAREVGVPVLAILHGEQTNKSYLTATGQAERFRSALSEVDRLVIVGAPLREYAARLAGRADHIEVVWNGVEPPAGRRAVPDPDADPLELIAVANLQEGKGVDILISALERLDRAGHAAWRLRIVGAGPMREALFQQAIKAGLADRIRFLGTRSNSQVFKELEECDVFVLPSYREAFGVAYLEAMASGLLAIGVKGQGPAQFMVNGETGLLVEPKSIESTVDALLTVMDGDRSGWREIAAKGADFVRRHATWDVHADKMTALMLGLVKGRVGRTCVDIEAVR